MPGKNRIAHSTLELFAYTPDNPLWLTGLAKLFCLLYFGLYFCLSIERNLEFVNEISKRRFLNSSVFFPPKKDWKQNFCTRFTLNFYLTPRPLTFRTHDERCVHGIRVIIILPLENFVSQYAVTANRCNIAFNSIFLCKKCILHSFCLVKNIIML